MAIKSNSRVLDVLTVAVLIGTVGLAASRWSAGERGEDTVSVPAEPVAPELWLMLRAGSMAIGPERARITIVEFTDYECPACRAAESTLRSLVADSSASVRVVYRSWPLEQHRMARRAARLAVCAAEAGVFAAIHHDLMSTSEWREYPDSAFRAIVNRHISADDTTRFWSCEGSERVRATVEEDIALARQLGGRGTPFFIIDGRPYQQLPERLVSEGARTWAP